MFSLIHYRPTTKQLLLLFIVSFLIRAGSFVFYVQYENRYCQPDTTGYHFAALCMKHGYGMKYPTKKPIFWRTPGYPIFLMPWYDTSIKTTDFHLHKSAHMIALWIQIFLCSFFPLLVLLFVFYATGSPPIGWTCALISMVHHGFILASIYMLTDGLGMIFFMLFLYALWHLIRFKGETALSLATITPRSPSSYAMIPLAALSLSAYTWLRPHGQFIAYGALILMLCSEGSWRTKIAKSLCFITLFMATLLPWYIRNYKLTGDFFFCPLFGLYLNVFNAPKIVARIEGISLKDAHTKQVKASQVVIGQELRTRYKNNDRRIVCGENMCLVTALPPILAHPGYFLYDWIGEVIKTTYDLYAYQLVALHNKTFSSDPLVEYLPEKLADTLYAQPLPWYFRLIGWIELCFNIVMWLGIFSGFFSFVCIPLLCHDWRLFTSYGYLWIKACFITGLVIMQTGGFGYARLRLPVEPLMIMMGIVAWWYYATKYGWLRWNSSTRPGALRT